MIFKEMIKTTESYKKALKLKPNKNCEEIQFEVKKFFSQVFEKQWHDVNEITLCVTYILSKFDSENEKSKLISASKAITLLWFLDDMMEANPEICDHWTSLYRSETNPNLDSKIEKAFALIVKDLKFSLTENQFKRYMEMMATFFELSETSDKLDKKVLKLSKQQFLDYRNTEGVVNIMSLFTEHVLGLNFSDDFFENKLIKEYHRLFANHIIIVNDMVSYRREKAKNSPMNYISLFNTDGNSVQQLYHELIIQLQRVEEDMLSLRIEIIKNNDNFYKQYFDALIDVVHGNYGWHLICRRYNEEVFSDIRN